MTIWKLGQRARGGRGQLLHGGLDTGSSSSSRVIFRLSQWRFPSSLSRGSPSKTKKMISFSWESSRSPSKNPLCFYSQLAFHLLLLFRFGLLAQAARSHYVVHGHVWTRCNMIPGVQWCTRIRGSGLFAFDVLWLCFH